MSDVRIVFVERQANRYRIELSAIVYHVFEEPTDLRYSGWIESQNSHLKMGDGGMPMGWTPFDEGRSLGEKGSEDGPIRRDEEHILGARITLEENTSHAPYAITCGIYGWMFHTRYFGSVEEGSREFDEMKAGLEEVLNLIASSMSSGGEMTLEQRIAIYSALDLFVDRFA